MEGNNFGGYWPIDKHWEFLLWSMQQRDHSFLSDGMTAQLLLLTAMIR